MRLLLLAPGRLRPLCQDVNNIIRHHGCFLFQIRMTALCPEGPTMMIGALTIIHTKYVRHAVLSEYRYQARFRPEGSKPTKQCGEKATVKKVKGTGVGTG